ncbi:hypothetical protein DPMN_127285 [Dreissena polymorpha]|uniref:Uncharacterized protein n=1 Tax=Dreissena polymorpha TaxID=45954 RepID=A0A9D4JUQ2_DREPO|nr:hypothetical protein DPMN_127285 [Dreissena polymorpha]
MSQASSDVKRDHIYLTSLVTRIPTRRHADLNKSSQSKTDPASSMYEDFVGLIYEGVIL